MSSNLTPSGRLHLIITGRVHGVFFRASAQELADELGLTGWVSNRADGTVELVAEGSQKSLDRMRSWAHHGPPSAHVEGVREIDEPATGEFTNFQLRGSY